MSTRKHQSGASKRKAKLEREEREKKLPKMTKYLFSAASVKSCHCSSTSSFQNPDSTGSASVEDLSTPPRFPGEQQDSPPFGSPGSAQRTATSSVSTCEQPTSSKPCPVPTQATSMPLGATPAMEFHVCVLPHPISTASDQQAPYVSNQPADDELQQTTLKEPTDFFHGSSTADHPPTCLEGTDQLASCGDKLQNPQQQEVGPEILQSDPAKWPDIITDNFRGECIERGPLYFQNRAESFPSSERQYKTQKRYMSPHLFARKAVNGEAYERHWLMYSKSKGCVYCFMCKLFSSNPSSFTTHGFSDWKRGEEKVCAHENSVEHRNCVAAWLTRSNSSSTIDKELVKHLVTQTAYWTEVMKRVVVVIKLLAERGLAFRGSEEVFGSPRNGNYMGVLEAIAQFDPFLEEHIKRYGNKGKGHPSYLSKTICDEFIELMAKAVKDSLIEEVKRAKYFSLIVDSTPDLTHVDQLSVVLRYCLNAKVHERFLGFVPIESHTGLYLFDTVMSLLTTNGISISNCRGQAYDNASNMSGKYKGLQAQIKQLNNLAVYVPCAGHSLNLVGACSVDSCLEAVKFFSVTQRLYAFFVASPKRWKCLLDSMDSTGEHLVLKSLSQTRWSRHAESCKAIMKNFSAILRCLEHIAKDEEENGDTRNEARSLLKKMAKLETAFMAIFWCEILERFDKTSVALQKPGLDISTAVDLLSSLEGFVDSLRPLFDTFEARARTMSSSQCYQDEGKRIAVSKYPDGKSDCRLRGRKKFLVETYNVVLDCLGSALRVRKAAYADLCEKFGFLKLLTENGSMISLAQQAERLVETYTNDLEPVFPTEIIQFANFLQSSGCQDTSALGIIKLLHERQLINVFPNLSIALRMYLSIPVTNCESERSFSKLSLIKNRLRSNLVDDKLNSLAIMSIERDLVRDLSFEQTISDFAKAKARKMPL